MNESLFSSLRIVASMLSSDKELHPLERAWFFALMNTLGANFEQRKILRKDLEGSQHLDLESIFRSVTNEKDKAHLLNFLTVAMHIDNKQTPAEKLFYARVKELYLKPSLSPSIDYTEYGRSILKRDKEIQVWKELESAGRLLNHRRGFMYWGYPYDSFDIILLSSWISELIFSRNKAVYTILASVILLIAIFICIFNY